MNQIVNKFLLAGDKFVPKMYLTQPGLRVVFVDNLSKTMKKMQIQDLLKHLLKLTR